jgi:hypothetical protein
MLMGHPHPWGVISIIQNLTGFPTELQNIKLTFLIQLFEIDNLTGYKYVNAGLCIEPRFLVHLITQSSRMPAYKHTPKRQMVLICIKYFALRSSALMNTDEDPC